MLLRCKRRRTTNFAFILLKFSTQGIIRRFMNIKFDELPMIVGFVLKLIRNALHYLWFRIPESDINFLPLEHSWPTPSTEREAIQFYIVFCTGGIFWKPTTTVTMRNKKVASWTIRRLLSSKRKWSTSIHFTCLL